MNKFLQTRADIDDATRHMEQNGFVCSGISAKNWEIFQVIPYFRDGNWLDMGSDGGVVLDNLVKENIRGQKIGIDLSYLEDVIPPEGMTLYRNDTRMEGVKLYKGDLMATPFEDGIFDFITSLSVIEHEVDFSKFAKEVSRLLKSGGHLFVSFDYWNPKPLYEKRKLYKLDWNILDEKDVLNLIDVLRENGLHLVGDIDWTLQEAVINPRYCSPADVEYTFGIFHFIKI